VLTVIVVDKVADVGVVEAGEQGEDSLLMDGSPSELYQAANDPTLSAYAWATLVEWVDAWSAFAHARGKLYIEIRYGGCPRRAGPG
jgi:hypothetical protein